MRVTECHTRPVGLGSGDTEVSQVAHSRKQREQRPSILLTHSRGESTQLRSTDSNVYTRARARPRRRGARALARH